MNEFIDQVIETLRKGWTKGWYSRNADGTVCNGVLNPNACCWCIQGAISRVSLLTGSLEIGTRLRYNIEQIVGRPIVVWNDDLCTSVDEIIKVLEQCKNVPSATV